MDNKSFLITLNMADPIGSITYPKLITHFSNPEKVLSVPNMELIEEDGIREKTANSIKSFRLEEEIKDELNRIEKTGVNILTINDNEYPSSLKTIYAPPPVLYVKGKTMENDAIAVAIVGSRSPTTYGKLVTEKISTELSVRGVTIVS